MPSKKKIVKSPKERNPNKISTGEILCAVGAGVILVGVFVFLFLMVSMGGMLK